MSILYLSALAVAIPVIILIIRWFATMIGALARGPGSRCPACWSKRTRRSRRRVADTFFPAFMLPHRCENCRRRFFSLRPVSYVHPAKPTRASRPMLPATAQGSSRR
jgi:hypothetical protein